MDNNKKIVLLWVLDILREYSDENHLLTYNEIKSKLMELHNVSPNVKSIASNIDTLEAYGFDIQKAGNKGCYLGYRDFENKIIQVNYGITQIPKFDDQGNILSRTTVIGDTKTSASVREVPMPDILVDALKEWRKVQWIKKEITKKDLISPQSLVFCNYDGSVRTYSGTRHTFNRFLKRHNLDMYGIQFHTLRHTYSSMLFESGENPKIIQALLGHKSVNTTLTVYNSVDKTYFKQATERLNDLFNKEKVVNNNVYKQDLEEMQSQKTTTTFEDDEQLQIEALQKLLNQKLEQQKNRNKDFEM